MSKKVQPSILSFFQKKKASSSGSTPVAAANGAMAVSPPSAAKPQAEAGALTDPPPTTTRSKRVRDTVDVLSPDDALPPDAAPTTATASKSGLDLSIMKAPLTCLVSGSSARHLLPKKILVPTPAELKKKPVFAALAALSQDPLASSPATREAATKLQTKTIDVTSLSAKIDAAPRGQADAAQMWLEETLKLAIKEVPSLAGTASSKVVEYTSTYSGRITTKTKNSVVVPVKIPRRQKTEEVSLRECLSWLYFNPEMLFKGKTKASRVNLWTTIEDHSPLLVLHIDRMDRFDGPLLKARLNYPAELSVSASRSPGGEDSWDTKPGPEYTLSGVVVQTNEGSGEFEAFVPSSTPDGAKAPSKWTHHTKEGKQKETTLEKVLGHKKTATLLSMAWSLQERKKPPWARVTRSATESR